MFESANDIHLKRLFKLRNLAIAGQIIAILFTQHFLDIPLPLTALALIVISAFIFNIYVWYRLNQSNTNSLQPVTENEIFFHLAFDVITLGLILYFTGGASNPFILLFLFPLTITVTILPVRYAWLLAVLSVICYSLLMFYYQPLPIEHDIHAMHSDTRSNTNSTEYNLHLIGMWMAFILNACLITYYVYGMSNTLRYQQKQLADAREQTLRDEQLVLLGTLAASTAHELGTPLGTMSLLVNEIELELAETIKQNMRIQKDFTTLKSQITRCKSSLTDLSASVGASSDLFGGQKQDIQVYFLNLLNDLRNQYSNVNLIFNNNINTGSFLYTDRTLSLSLVNIIENAIEVSPDFVDITLERIGNFIKITINDNGPGLSEQALQTIGEKPFSEKELGLGLGLFLAYAAIKRRGGTINHVNRINNESGSQTSITLPLSKAND